MKFEQEDPPTKTPELITKFVKHCRANPGVWYVLKRDALGNFSKPYYKHGDMEWRMATKDGRRTFYGRTRPV